MYMYYNAIPMGLHNTIAPNVSDWPQSGLPQVLALRRVQRWHF